MIVVDDVVSTTGGFGPGSVVTVRGRFSLASRESGTLLLGTTTIASAGESPMQASERVQVDRGSGQFELQHRCPGYGHLHVTFYDRESGAPFGGQYFGRSDSLLVAKTWAYAR